MPVVIPHPSIISQWLPVPIRVYDMPRWVKLRGSLETPDASDVLLLCEDERGDWVAWSPDRGEITLRSDQFWM